MLYMLYMPYPSQELVPLLSCQRLALLARTPRHADVLHKTAALPPDLKSTVLENAWPMKCFCTSLPCAAFLRSPRLTC